jgi:hypothetical protein
VPEFMATEVTHPIFSNVKLKRRFLQTTEGDLYYTHSDYYNGYRKGGRGLKREKAKSCDEWCDNCGGDCFTFYIIRQRTDDLARPRAIIDFQRSHDFPNGDQSRPTSLINIPLIDKFINSYRKGHFGTFKQVSKADGRIIWNASSNWLWDMACNGWYRHEAEMLEILLQAGADPNYYAKNEGITTFNCMVRKGVIEGILLLAENGANPNLVSIQRRNYYPNSIYLAMDQSLELEKKKEIFEILIGMGVNINAQNRDKDGQTLLHWVVADTYKKDRADLFRLLLSLGVDKNITSHKGVSPLDLAKSELNLAKSRRDRDIANRYSSNQEEQELADLNAIISLLE